MLRNITCACRRSDDEDYGAARDNLFQAVVCVPSTLEGRIRANTRVPSTLIGVRQIGGPAPPRKISYTNLEINQLAFEIRFYVQSVCI